MLSFVTGLLHRGEVLLLDPPTPAELAAPLEPEAASALERAFARHALDVAGSPIAFEPTVARRSAELLQLACWLLVHTGAPRSLLATSAQLLGKPASASDHLSADLFLRYLPLVYRRARSLDTSDPLGHELALVLRRFPLSGVLAPVPEGPDEGAFDMARHAGLALLYAERLAARDDPAWTVSSGPVRDQLELVLAEQDREKSRLLAPREPPEHEETDAS